MWGGSGLVLTELSKLNGKNAQKGGEEIVGIEKVTKVQEICKKVLTKRGGSGRIIKLSRERQRKKNVAVKGCRKELEKIFEKFFKNLLTNRLDCDIIDKLSAKRRAKLNLDN